MIDGIVNIICLCTFVRQLAICVDEKVRTNEELKIPSDELIRSLDEKFVLNFRVIL